MSRRFKWQVPISEPIGIPCRRGIYQIGLSSIVLYNVANRPENGVLYVCLNPYTEDSCVWLGDRTFINSIKTIIKPPDSIIRATYFKDEIDFHEIDFSTCVSTFRVYITNSEGDSVSASGYAIFEMLTQDGCTY